MRSLLSGVTKAQVETDPFPHVVVRGALEKATADQLLAEIPPVDVITGGARYGSNEYFDYSAGQSLRDNSLSPLWRELLEVHSSASFAREAFDLFDEHLPDAVRRIVNGVNGPRYGTRGIDDFTSCDVLVDAQIVLNTPVVGTPSSVKGAHVDRPRAFYGATCYLRKETDASEGGALELLRMRGSNLRRFDGLFVSDDEVEVVKTIPYEHNVFVFWPNSIDALHRVSPRSVTDNFRYYVNFLAQQKHYWYDMTPYQRGRRPKRGHGLQPERAPLVRRVLRKVRRLSPAR